MKKLIMMMAIIATSSVAMAQTEGFTKGSLFLSGSVGFSNEKFEEGEFEDKNSTFMFNPRIGYFVSNNIAVGLNAGIGSSKNEDEDGDEFKMMTTNIGLFGRYYFNPANKFSMFMHLGADYVSSKNEFEGEDTDKWTGFSVGLAPGLHYFISNRLALETSVGLLGFSSLKQDEDFGEEKQNNFDFNLGLNNITFGLVFKLK